MNRGIIFALIAILVLGLMMGKFIAAVPQMPLIIIAAAVIALLTIIKTDVALIILIFSMLLSPELKVADIPQRAVVVRVDDVLIFVVFFTWLAKMAINKQLGLLRRTPVNRPIGAYIAVCLVSTAIGIAAGTVQTTKSFFYVLKYIEYFLIFFMISNNIQSKRQVKMFIVAAIITCALVCIYASSQVGTGRRTSAPFEGESKEPNTLGGYLVLLFAICAGLFAYSPDPTWRFWTGAMACFIMYPFLYSLSRGSYLAFTAMYLTLVVLTRKKKTLLLIILLLAIGFFPMVLPKKVTDRVTKTFVPGKHYEILGERIALDESAAYRIESWKNTMEMWVHRPLLGYGITGVGLVDTQYAQILGETGIIGAWIFAWLMITVFRNALRVFNTVEDDWSRGLALGFIAGFAGMLVHAFSANTFIIVRIMEPFWFLTAVVLMLPEVNSPPEAAAQTASAA